MVYYKQLKVKVFFSMALDKISPVPGVSISIQAIAQIVGNAANECYGVMGLCPSPNFKSTNIITNKGDFYKCVECVLNKKGYDINVYIYTSNNVKITEIGHEIQKKVKYVLKQTFDIVFNNVNVFVEGLKEDN